MHILALEMGKTVKVEELSGDSCQFSITAAGHNRCRYMCVAAI